MASMERIAADLILLSNEFAHLNALAASDVSLIADDDWARKVNPVLVLMTIHAGEVLALDVPTTMRSIHSSFTNMVSEIHAFAARYADGIDHADVVTIQGALLHVAEADRWSREATQQMEALCREDKVGTSG